MHQVALTSALVLFLFAMPVRAEPASPPPQVTETSGLALGLQIPTGAGMLGARADYLFQIPDSFLRFGVYAGIGAWLCIEPSCHASALFGALTSWGHRHRVVFEIFSGTLGGVGVTLHGDRVASRAVWGLAAQIGYEYMSESGFFTHFGAGVGFLFEPAIEKFSNRVGPAITLVHFGYKLW